jgi:hypothetical protein
MVPTATMLISFIKTIVSLDLVAMAVTAAAVQEQASAHVAALAAAVELVLLQNVTQIRV